MRAEGFRESGQDACRAGEASAGAPSPPDQQEDPEDREQADSEIQPCVRAHGASPGRMPS